MLYLVTNSISNLKRMVAPHKQQTIANSISCIGVGVHTGKEVKLTLEPAPADYGIVFIRTDLASDRNVIPARYDTVSCTKLCTTISNEHGVSVSTIEHIMAALWASGIDNVTIKIDAPEVPIMDGSSEPFVLAIESAGIKLLDKPRRFIEVLEAVRVQQGEAFLEITPNESFALEIEIDFPHASAIGSQRCAFAAESGREFRQQLSRARTFACKAEVEQLRAMGLGRGGSLENAVVVDEDKVLNPEGFRYKDEPVRHKTLDCLGDFFTAGFFINGLVRGSRTGHSLNNMLLRELLANSQAWRYVTIS